ncbi:hypothetical protein N8569_00720 [bacterium]|nr:hypothetical protein [bacterium]
MTEHTPGPWIAEILDGYITGHVTSPNKHGPKSMHRRDSITDHNGMTQHDAFLIAAAPCLLEALKALLPAALDVRDAWDQEDAYRNFEDAVDIANAALARAEPHKEDRP